MRPLERLYEAPGLPDFDLPPLLEELHGGPFGLHRPRLFANFVSSIDGVVALESAHSPATISGGSEGDRFVMALLRASADAVLIGGATMRADPGHMWTPEFIFPDGTEAFAELRSRLGLPPQPQLVVLSGRGQVDAGEEALDGAVVLTSAEGEDRLRSAGARAKVIALGPGPWLDPRRSVQAVRDLGHRVILSEGGPTLTGQLLRHGALEELFLTVSPVLAGRAESSRPGLVDGVALLPQVRIGGRLLSVRRHESHLFLRYELSRPGGPAATEQAYTPPS